MTNPSKECRNRKPIAETELAEMLNKTETLQNPHFRLRVRALIGLLKKFGKRRRELSGLRMKDLEFKDGFLFVTFQIAKKLLKYYSNI